MTLEDTWSCFHLSFAVKERIRGQPILTPAMQHLLSSAILNRRHFLVKNVLRRRITNYKIVSWCRYIAVGRCCIDIDNIDVIDIDKL